MKNLREESFVERLDKAPYPSAADRQSLVPVYDYAVYLALAAEAALNVGRHGGDDLVMVVDANTATLLHSLNDLRSRAAKVVVYGEVPQPWAKADNVITRNYNDALRDNDHVLLLISSKVSLVFLGTQFGDLPEEGGLFKGGWTLLRNYVSHTLGVLTGEECTALLEKMDTPQEAAPQITEISLRLMSLHADALATRQQDIAMDKNDLFSVLNILKAISAKRRAHDILFVFVEQIARVVSSNRCSVVRVWGGKEQGQVLASHEDASVVDREIDLDKYPEIHKAMSTHEKVVINDVKTDSITAPFSDTLGDAGINALLVIPIVLYDQNIGSLLLRAARSTGSFTLREISFFEIVTEAASNALERAHLFESIQIANESLERLAITDGLTGLYNHRYFRDRLEQELERALRYRLPLSCLIFDVDDFKKFNDTYGHLLGDDILREIADRTQRCVRKSDIVARYGGEEFVVIMPQTDKQGAMVQAERLRQVIADSPFYGVPDNTPVTVSVGVAVLDFDAMLVCEDLLRVADQALYEAKGSGKNKVVGPKL